MMKYKVNEPIILRTFLEQKLDTTSKKKIKSYLAHGNVFVNEEVQTRYDTPLLIGDIVEIKSYGSFPQKNSELKILYEDKELIVVDKPSGLLTIANETEAENTMYHMVREYIKKKNKNGKVFIVHRLDRDTSGVLMFAKNEKIKKMLQENWNQLVMERGYVALVEGKISKKNGRIHTWLKESSSYKVYITKNKKEGKEAITDYKVLKIKDGYSVVEIDLKTGRKNQIRVHFSSLGHPVVGDKKYDAETNPIHRLGLHANKLTIVHPITKKKMTFISEVPTEILLEKRH